MERILIQVKNKEKAKLLRELLTALDFVEFIESDAGEEKEAITASHIEQTDFFAMAGLWESRNITLESLRNQAWPRQQHGSL